jgi:hypothetical protein
MYHFDYNLQVDFGDLPTRCVTCFEVRHKCATEARNDRRTSPPFRALCQGVLIAVHCNPDHKTRVFSNARPRR